MLTYIFVFFILWFLYEVWRAYWFIQENERVLLHGNTSQKSLPVPTENYDHSVEIQKLISQPSKNGGRGIMGLAPPISLEIMRESITWLTAGPLFLMQLDYPPIAFALERHAKNFEGREMAIRALNTIVYAHRVFFEEFAQMLGISRRVFGAHKATKGEIPEDCGQFKKGDQYDGLDPKALMWVYGTTVYYNVAAYELFVRQLTPKEKETHYAFMRSTTHVWGLDPETTPTNWEDFNAYMSKMVQSGILHKSRPGTSLVNSVYKKNPLRRINTMALLPKNVREHFMTERWLLMSCPLIALIRMVYTCLPLQLRQLTIYGDWDRNLRGKDPDLLDKLGIAIGNWLFARTQKGF